MLDKLFLVATEFKFEAGSALLASQQIQGAAQGITKAVDSALGSMQAFGLGVAAQLNIAHLGVVGLLQEALSVSDHYRQKQLAFANILSANKDHLVGPIDTFNQRLMVSDQILTRIGKAARDFSLDENAMVEFTKLTAAMLIPKGLAGDNLQRPVDIARTLLKSAPTLGVQPWQIQNELLEIIEGRASGNNTLFRRLNSDTNVFKTAGATGNSGTAFNALPATKRVELLDKALKAFSSDVEVLEGNVNTVAGQIRRLANLFTGEISSVLRPFGDLLRNTIVPILKQVGNYIDKEGRVIIEQVTKFLKPWAQDLQGTYTTLKQLKSLRTDIDMTKKVAELITMFSLIRFVMKLFGVGVVVNWSMLGSALGSLGTAAKTAIPLVGMVGTLMMRMFWWIPLVLAGFQLISKAKAIADVENAKSLAKGLPDYLIQLNRISAAIQVILRPYIYLWNKMAEGLSWIFRLDGALAVLGYVFKWVADYLSELAKQAALFQAITEGFAVAMIYALQRIMDGNFKNLGADTWMTFKDNAKESFAKNMSMLMNPENNMTASMVTNIGSVAITNSFKEQMEPDRIAFTIRDQLLSAARNPISARGNVTRNTGSKQ